MASSGSFDLFCGSVSRHKLLSSSITSADSSASTGASITVDSACILSITGTGTYTATITAGNYSEIVGSPINATCKRVILLAKVTTTPVVTFQMIMIYLLQG